MFFKGRQQASGGGGGGMMPLEGVITGTVGCMITF